jgi:hypothetical protein
MIRENLDQHPSQIEPDVVANDPRVQYNMGTSEKFGVHVPMFLQRNQGDPAVKVNNLLFLPAPKLMPPLQNYFSKLREHLLPRVQAQHQRGAKSHSTQHGTGSLDGNMFGPLFLKNDSIYCHKRIRFHYTTYNV